MAVGGPETDLETSELRKSMGTKNWPKPEMTEEEKRTFKELGMEEEENDNKSRETVVDREKEE